MTQNFNIAIFDGDGIGPEFMAPTVELLRAFAERRADYEFTFTNLPAGGSPLCQDRRIASKNIA